MVAVIFDEAADAALHRFLSLLRLLTFFHPRVGADLYAVSLGISTQGLIPGWNAVHSAAGAEVPVIYINISTQEGLTTKEHPDVPDEQIHITREEDLPPLEESPAWRMLMQLAEVVGERQPEGITSTWVQERLEVLQGLATLPLRGEDEGVDVRIDQALALIRDAVNGPNAALLAFTRPVEEVLHDFLSFRLTGTQAYNILAVLLTYYAIKFPSPLDETGGAKPVTEQIDYLINLSSTINRDRHRYDLGSYAQLTYLGLLWANTAVLMAKQVAKRVHAQNLPEDLSRWFKRRALYAEESTVHELVPSLMHPIVLAPFSSVEYQRAQTAGINPQGLYAGAGKLGNQPFVPEDAWARVQAYSASCDRLGSSYGAYEDFLSPALQEHLSMFLLAMSLG